MTNLEALAGRLRDCRLSLDVAEQATAALLALPDDDLLLTCRQSARLLIRADKLADAVERLADELALATPDWPSGRPIPPPVACGPS
jgi:hypothetical protein